MRTCQACSRSLPDDSFRICTPAGARRKVCKSCQVAQARARRHRDDFDIDVEEDTAPATEPAPPGTLDLEHLTDDARTALIAAIIPEAARASGVEPCDVTWADFRAYAQIAWGESNCGIARRHITRVGGFNKIRDAHYPPRPTDFALERRELTERANAHRETARRETRDALLVRQLEEVLARAPLKVMPAEGYARKYSEGYQGKRVVTSVWNDDHFAPGCALPGYDEDGQCRRVARIVSQQIDFKRHYRERTEARILINGDMIENWLHGKRWAHPSVQAVSAAEKYAQAIQRLAAEFPRVHVMIVPGNHDRDVAFDPKRAIDEKAYGYTTVIAGLIRAACRELKNVRLEVASPEGFFDSFGSRVMVTHGDTILGQVSPRSINTTAAAFALERYNAAQGALGPVKLVWMGHWHVDAHATTDSGVQIRFNPALTPSNEFARSVGAFSSFNGHYVYEETPGHVFGDNRLVRVDMETSRDASLDGVIAPFVPFDGAA